MIAHARAVIDRPGSNTYRLDSIRFSVVREADPRKRHGLSRPEDVAAFLRIGGLIPDDAKEHFGILMLTSQNGFIAHHEVSVGTLSSALVTPREVFGPALRVMGVASLILYHNHPSGDPTPSGEDLRLTRQLVEAGKLLQITIHDHLILGNGTEAFVSLAQRGAV